MLAVLACEPFGPGETVEIEGPGAQGEGRIRLVPDTLDFGTVSVLTDGSATLGFQVVNTEADPIEVVGLDRVAGDGEAFATDAPALVQLEGHGVLDVTVTFTPTTSRDYSGDLFPNGQVTLALDGHGSAPVASLWPGELDWGSVAVGCDTVETVQLLNTGDEDLEVLDAALITDTDFAVDGFEPLVLAPGESAALDLHFAPEFDGLQATVLHVETNDPLAPVVTLDLDGSAHEGDPITESVPFQPTAQTDILLVQDASSTVTTRVEAGTQYTQGFLETLDAAGVDWQISLVRADHDCLASPYPWLRSAEGAAKAASALNLELTRPGQGDAALLETAVASLERTDPGDCLEGFLREDAQLHTILIGDRREDSPSTAENYVSTMAAKLETAEDLVVSAVMGHGQNGCQDLGQAVDAVESTGGMDLDLCDPDWGDHFAALAAVSTSTVPDVQSYTLHAEPLVDTLEVWHGGAPIAGWTYDEDTRVLTVNGDEAGLETGTELHLTYVEAAICQQ